ncbi:hypothetical protein JXQ70_12800 [bacterium]|nr:hypothetical protein [bacterium]
MEVMDTEPTSVELRDVIQKFERWHHNRLHREIIPEELWEAALSLIPSYPATKVAQILHLNYTKLKERLPGASAPVRSASRRERSPWPFVEVGLSASSSLSGQPSGGSSLVIEIEKPSDVSGVR